MKTDWLEGLREMAGNYAGRGKNHEGEHFSATFGLEVCESGKGAALTYRALVDEAVVHDEKSLVGRDEEGRLSLFSLTSNTPVRLRRSVEFGNEAGLIFRTGAIRTIKLKERLWDADVRIRRRK